MGVKDTFSCLTESFSFSLPFKVFFLGEIVGSFFGEELFFRLSLSLVASKAMACVVSSLFCFLLALFHRIVYNKLNLKQQKHETMPEGFCGSKANQKSFQEKGMV